MGRCVNSCVSNVRPGRSSLIYRVFGWSNQSNLDGANPLLICFDGGLKERNGSGRAYSFKMLVRSAEGRVRSLQVPSVRRLLTECEEGELTREARNDHGGGSCGRMLRLRPWRRWLQADAEAGAMVVATVGGGWGCRPRPTLVFFRAGHATSPQRLRAPARLAASLDDCAVVATHSSPARISPRAGADMTPAPPPPVQI
jgi:hypothetical protein